MKKKLIGLCYLYVSMQNFLYKVKLITFLIFVSVASATADSYSQQTKFTLNMKNIPVGLVLQEIEKTSEFIFIYSEKSIDINRKVDVNIEDENVTTILDQLFKGTINYYEIHDRQIVILPSEMKDLQPLMKFGSEVEQPQKKNLSGTVKDSKGLTLPGVSVLVKGTTIGTMTDTDGNFRLSVPADVKTLMFSFVGMKSQEFPIDGKTTLSVVMADETVGVDEVVVVGYGTEKRKSMTSSVSSVKAADLEEIPMARIDNMLQGRAAGMQIIQNNGAPGTGGSTIRIRGISSLTASSDPLLIVDGVPINGFIEDVNPNDIESVEVLKDAAAASIYGARASNGVILITTKRGKGKPKVTFTTSYGIQNIAKKYDVLSGPEQWEIMREMFNNNPLAAKPDWWNQTTATEIYKVDTTSNYNWSEALLQENAPILENNLMLTGSEGKISYATSLNYFDQKGILQKTGFQRISGRLNLDLKLTEKLSFGNSLSIAQTNPRSINTAADGFYMSSLVKSPLLPQYDENGTYSYFDPFGGPANPLPSLNEINRKNKSNRLIASVYGQYKIIEWLTFKSTWGYEYRGNTNSTFTRSTQNVSGNTSGGYDWGERSQWINTNLLSFDKQFGDHKVSALAIYEQQEFMNSTVSGSASIFPSDNVGTLNAASKIDNVNSNISSYGLESWAGRVTYNYKEKYIVSGNVRRDGSSRFGKDNQWATFPSVSMAWSITDEPFMKDIRPLSYLKLRGSAGQVGNQNGLSNFGARGLYRVGADYSGAPGIAVSSISNPQLKWETTTQYNVGLEAGFLKDRITFTADIYKKVTNDLLLARQTAQSSGVGTVTMNLGKMENKGLEISVTSRNLVGKFQWKTDLIFSLNRNKVAELYGKDNDLIYVFAQQRIFGLDNLESVVVVGKPLGSLFGMVSEGVYLTPDELLNQKGERWKYDSYVMQLGDRKYKDVNLDGVINLNDRTLIGHMEPAHTGGINNNFSYKGVYLDVFMNWSYGNDIFNATRMALMLMEAPGINSITDVRGRWRKEGDVTDIPRAVNGLGGNPNSVESTANMEDGSFLRLSNVTIGYNIPLDYISKHGFSKLKIYLTGNNIALLTKYKGIDPDVRSWTTEGQYGIDFGAYPRARTFSLGLQVEF